LNGLSEDEAPEAVEQLGRSTEALRSISDQIRPIYEYYFPQSWLTAFSNAFRKDVPDYSRYLGILTQLSAEARQAIRESEAACQIISASTLYDDLKTWCYAAYKQNYLDGTTWMMFSEYVQAMHVGDPRLGVYFRAMKKFSDDARQHLPVFQEAMKTVNAMNRLRSILGD
jgi:hypothetical protein